MLVWRPYKEEVDICRHSYFTLLPLEDRVVVKAERMRHIDLC
jgi:hypothetical protein